MSNDPSSSALIKPAAKTEETQQVFLGIFPASHIHVRDELADAEGRLAELAAASAVNSNGQAGANGENSLAKSRPDYSRHKSAHSIKERDERDEDTPGSERKSFKLGPPADQATSSRAGLNVYPASVRSMSRSSSPTSTHSRSASLSAAPGLGEESKLPPPKPTIKAADDTHSGATQPIIDEISSALREWHTLMFEYLARREYALFHVVKEHIETLHLGRRQLLAQTLSQEETAALLRECVQRLVSGNIVQGLDVIVRHPTYGGLVTCDMVVDAAEGATPGQAAAATAQAVLEIDRRSWVSAIRMYAMQVGLAYMDIGPHDGRLASAAALGSPLHGVEFAPGSAPLPTPAHSAFPDAGPQRARGRSSASRLRSLSTATSIAGAASSSAPAPAAKALPTNFYHVFLDVRAFVASPCAPGETAELFFSLYNKAEARFVTEEFCAVLSHHGVLARDPAAKVRTLFIDLVRADVQDPIVLVCRIVRNGALKPGSGFAPGAGAIPEEGGGAGGGMGRRRSEASVGYGYGERGGYDHGMGFRRPFGCAVLELTQLAKIGEEGRWEMSSAREHTMPIFVPANESIFSMLHEDIIAGKTREYEKSPK
jgi:dedicator of cytokinesis protein 3